MKLPALILLFSISFQIEIHAQVQLLKKYDFQKGHYYLLGLAARQDPDLKGTAADTLFNFYSDDKALLNEIRKEWIFKERNNLLGCGFTYSVLLCRDGKRVSQFDINLECDEIQMDERSVYYFKQEKLTRYLKRFRKEPGMNRKVFTELSAGRKYLDSMRKAKETIYASGGEWERFEGSFDFSYDFINDSEREEHESVVAAIEQKIKRTYPGEPFTIFAYGLGPEDMDLRVTCNESLFQKFNLYQRKWKWEPFKVAVSAFWQRVDGR